MSTARNALNFAKDHKYAIGATCLSLGIDLFERAWSLNAPDHLFIWRVSEYVVVPLIHAGMAGTVGYIADKTDKAAVSPNSHSMFYNNKFAVIFGAVELGLTAFTHFWAVPNTNYTLAWKLTYSGLMPVLHTAQKVVLGHTLDNTAKLVEQVINEDSSLLNNRL